MLFMNTWDIDEAVCRFARHPVLSAATRTLANLRDAADCNSDGWCYWPKPARAAAKLMALIQANDKSYCLYDRSDATPAAYREALKPIKAFRTRSGISFEIVE